MLNKLETATAQELMIFFSVRSGIAESPLNWLDSYFAWLSFDGGCCGYYKHSASEDSSNLVLCDKPGESDGGFSQIYVHGCLPACLSACLLLVA